MQHTYLGVVPVRIGCREGNANGLQRRRRYNGVDMLRREGGVRHG